MELLTSLASGSGIIGTLAGGLGGIVSAFVKYKTLKETNRHAQKMQELANAQQLQQVKIEGEIKTDLAAEKSLQASLSHDASLGGWLHGRELGPVAMFFFTLAEFVRMLMRPVLTIYAFVYVITLSKEYMQAAREEGLAGVAVLAQVDMVASTIMLLATVSFTWWFADRSVSKSLARRLEA